MKKKTIAGLITVVLIASVVVFSGCVEEEAQLQDSDGDSWSDQQEINAGTDPNNKDTDGDGYWDAKDENPLDPDIPVKQTILTPMPTSIEPSMTLEEIYREFYYDILGWGNVYDSSTLHRYIEQKDEEKLRRALKDFDTIIEDFINNVKENGYESRVDEEFMDWDDILEVHASLRWVDRLDIDLLCDVVEDMPGFVTDLKEGLREFIS